MARMLAALTLGLVLAHASAHSHGNHRIGNLTNEAIKITHVRALDYLDMTDANGNLQNAAQWTGLFKDLSAWIAHHSGATITNLEPSGTTGGCNPPSGTTRPTTKPTDKAALKQYAGQYSCAQSDVVEGLSDVYMGFFFINSARQAVSDMTTPLFPNSGLVIVGKQAWTWEEFAAQRKTACVPSGTALATFITDNLVPTGVVVEPYSGSSEMLAKIEAGTCDAFVEDLALAEQWVSLNCDKGFAVGKPLSHGISELAFGVNTAKTDVTDALNYWINYLRHCNPVNTASKCNQGWPDDRAYNWQSLYEKFRGSECSAAAPSAPEEPAAPPAASEEVAVSEGNDLTMVNLVLLCVLVLMVGFQLYKHSNAPQSGNAKASTEMVPAAAKV